jgi:hypothetical protein
VADAVGEEGMGTFTEGGDFVEVDAGAVSGGAAEFVFSHGYA